jgi:CTP synthase
MCKYIFVIGGVVSSLGKGIASSSIGLLLKRMGYRVNMIKLDPYLNVDPGTMSPFQHGEVFVTDDGVETDLDLGHYERFIDRDMGRHSNTTAGRIYERVLERERRGDFLGKTVQVIPHVTNEIIAFIRTQENDSDVILCEIGGTVGDIESLPFLEAVRQLRLEAGPGNSLVVFLTYVPYVRAAGEIKTKPTQHSAYKLREIGLQPDVLLCRCEKLLNEETKSKIALFTNVYKGHVIDAVDVDNIYRVPLNYRQAGLHRIICDGLHLEARDIDLSDWEKFLESSVNSTDEVTIAVCGKYVVHQDAYKSVEQSLIHAAAWNNLKINILWVDSEKTVQPEHIREMLKNADGVLVPGGFGVRGIEGKIAIARHARENGIPYFGICLGMQVAVIEFAQTVCGLEGAYSTEFEEATDHPVIALMEDQTYGGRMGGTMRLGGYDCKLTPGSLAHEIYGADCIRERHRHRYEFNNKYRETLTGKGLRITGTTPDNFLVEIVELPEHPFYIGVQFHPEFRSRPDRPHPVFRDFVAAARQHRLRG